MRLTALHRTWSRSQRRWSTTTVAQSSSLPCVASLPHSLPSRWSATWRVTCTIIAASASSCCLLRLALHPATATSFSHPNSIIFIRSAASRKVGASVRCFWVGRRGIWGSVGCGASDELGTGALPPEDKARPHPEWAGMLLRLVCLHICETMLQGKQVNHPIQSRLP